MTVAAVIGFGVMVREMRADAGSSAARRQKNAAGNAPIARDGGFLFDRRSAELPPPGTLGITYHKPSRLIPRERHPRIGMLDVWNRGDADLTVDGMRGTRGEDGVWRFESSRPLIPGIPHIYQVRALVKNEGRMTLEVRTVRLIRGRIVDLEF